MTKMEKRLQEMPHAYKKDIEKAVKILIGEGCKEVFIFGSLVEGRIRDGSDIDLAVKGCPPGEYYKILGKLLLELDHPVDLINLDKKSDFVQHIEQKGVLVSVH